MDRGRLIHDRYELVALLGRGGMAEVWRARDGRLDRSVAIKLLSPAVAGEPDYLVRFFREAQSVAGISHPNVVTVLDFGQDDHRPYLVMEYAPGGSLADITGAPMNPDRARDVVSKIASGAGAAHARGVVHRDIKPANVLLDERGTPKLADFGIASAAGAERLTATGTTVGSPHYISPEQASGVAATPASDVYSLGVVLYELLTGRRPFDAEGVMAVLVAHVEKTPSPPGAHVDDLDPHLEAVVMRCLSKDPSERFATGAELSAALGGRATTAVLEPADRDPTLVAASGATRPLTAERATAAAPTHAPRPSPRSRRAVLVSAVVVALLAGALIAAAVISSSGTGPLRTDRDRPTRSTPGGPAPGGEPAAPAPGGGPPAASPGEDGTPTPGNGDAEPSPPSPPPTEPPSIEPTAPPPTPGQ